MRAFWAIAVLLLGCDSDHEGESKEFVDSGGTMTIDGCGYTLTTRVGAEAPKPSGQTLGPDPTPRVVHLGIMGDPKTSIVRWRPASLTTFPRGLNRERNSVSSRWTLSCRVSMRRILMADVGMLTLWTGDTGS